MRPTSRPPLRGVVAPKGLHCRSGSKAPPLGELQSLRLQMANPVGTYQSVLTSQLVIVVKSQTLRETQEGKGRRFQIRVEGPEAGLAKKDELSCLLN